MVLNFVWCLLVRLRVSLIGFGCCVMFSTCLVDYLFIFDLRVGVLLWFVV